MGTPMHMMGGPRPPMPGPIPQGPTMMQKIMEEPLNPVNPTLYV